jgi:hypothetical protein
MRHIFVVLACLALSLPAFGSSTRILDGAQITNGAALLTLPTSTGSIPTLSSSDTFTNKTISGASNTLSLIPVGAIGNGSVLSGSNSGDMSLDTYGAAHGLSLLGQVLNISASGTSSDGVLLQSDWNTFNGKQAALGFTAVPDSRTINGHALTSNVTVSASDVSLGNVANVNQIPMSYLDTYTGLGTADNKVPSQNAVKVYVDTAVGGASGAPSVIGSTGSPTLITAVGGIAFTGAFWDNVKFIGGLAGPVDITANPQISAGTAIGQRLTIIGTDDTNTVKLDDGTGLSLNGSVILANHSVIRLIWDGTVWAEEARR